MPHLLALAGCALLLGGCMNAGKMVDSLGKDHANVWGGVTSVYGRGSACRTNPSAVPGSTVVTKCDQEGMAVTVTTPPKLP